MTWKVCTLGIILLPTSEKEDFAYCLYMTSDESRATRESEKYKQLESKSIKLKSYVNLDQILKKVNNMETTSYCIEEDAFVQLLEDFYQFQISKQEQNPEFLYIKSKIEALLLVLKNKKSFGITTEITREDLDIIDSAKNKNKIGILLLAGEVIINGKNENNLNFNNEKEKKYFSVLLKLYDKIRNINLETIDLNDLNNELRVAYCDFRNSYYLINVDTLFEDVENLIYIFGSSQNEKNNITKFIEMEKERNKQKMMNISAKQEQKKIEQKKQQKGRNKQKIQKRYWNDIEKYGFF